MPFLKRDGVSLFYERTGGEGRPVVLVHGWSCDHTFLAPQAEHFARLGHAVFALDLRGHGHSDKPHQPYPISAFADDIAWTCGALGLLRPILIGHSMGGVAAFDAVCRFPDLTNALVMLDSGVVLPESSRAAIPKFAERMRGPDYRDLLREYVETFLFVPTDDASRCASILSKMVTTPQHVMVAAFAALTDYDARELANRLSAACLYVAANEPSPRCDMQALRSLIPGLRYSQTTGSGHFCQLEVPDQVNGMVDQFLALLPSG